MRVFLCRWQNGDVSIVGARDREHAIYVLDEFADASDAEMHEIKQLLIDFKLNNKGRLELQTFGEAFENELMEKAYPLIFNAQREGPDDDKSYLSKAVKAERQRLSPKEKARETDPLAKNLFIARVAADNHVSLATATTRVKNRNVVLPEAWHTIAAKCQALTSKQQSELGEFVSGSLYQNPLRMATVPKDELRAYDENDRLPQFLFASLLAVLTNASLVTMWRYISQTKHQGIGTFWRWLAQEVRALPLPDNAVANHR